MNLDQLRIAVRPRTILECLDLACLFSVRRALGIAIALLLGAVPMALINVLVIGPEGAVLLLPTWTFWVGLQIPWAMAPLTLFLGRALFADRLSPADWRSIAGGMVAGIVPMMVYQTLLRGLALLIVMPFPFFLVALFFVDPVILLERGRTAGVARRSMALVNRDLGRIVLAATTESVILVAGWCLAVVALDQLASLWAGHPVMGVFDLDAPDWNLGRALFTWRGQISLWGILALITVFRFVLYLDTRIRTEGWDVELKLRNPATYAGLERWRGAVAILGLASVFVAPAMAEEPPPPAAVVRDDAPGEGTPGDDGDSAAVRDAVTRQRFPWYDAQKDGYRPVVGSASADASKDDAGSRFSLPSLDLGGTLVKALMIVLLAAALAAAAWVLLRQGYENVAPQAEEVRRTVTIGREQLETLPEQARDDVDNLLSRIAVLLADGDHGGAAILYHGWQLVQLHAGGIIELAKGKTNRRYAAEVAERSPDLAALFRSTATLSERARFGRLPISAEEFSEVWTQRQALEVAGAEATP